MAFVKPGISFLVRCRNEAAYLARSLESLRGIKVDHEIVVILHLCTDSSRQTAQKYKALGLPISIYEYNQEISRAGYETLVTPADHPASIVSYSNYCLSLTSYNWVIKWDADFFATNELISRFNKLDIGSQIPVRVKIGVQLGRVINAEYYLSNCLLRYDKYVFWEVPVFASDVQSQGSDEPLIKSLPVKVLKKYWQSKPWFLRPELYDKGLADKYKTLVTLLGAEPLGLARASNPECDKVFSTVLGKQQKLLQAGINFHK